MFKKDKVLRKKTVVSEIDGVRVLTKTEHFKLYIIMGQNDRLEDEILGTTLLTDAQATVLNDTCSCRGIKVIRKL